MQKITRVSCCLMTIALLILRQLELNISIPMWIALFPLAAYGIVTVIKHGTYYYLLGRSTEKAMGRVMEKLEANGVDFDNLGSIDELTEAVSKAYPNLNIRIMNASDLMEETGDGLDGE